MIVLLENGKNVANIELKGEADLYLRRFYTFLVKNGGLSQELIEEGRSLIQQDDPVGYKVFYVTVRDMEPPPHALGWVEDIYEEGKLREQVSYLAEAFRGSTKTTSLTETFIAYQIGNHPERSNLLIQSADVGQADKHSGNIADIVKDNPMWKVWFPNIVPDKDKGWGAKGYWVKDLNEDYGLWQQKRHKDPTLVGTGYLAALAVGSHPTGVFAIDDINNDRNTESERELESVNRILKDTIYPMTEDSRYNLFMQTPWNERDALAAAKATGVYKCSKTPVLTFVEKPDEDKVEPGSIYFDELNKWIIPTWPEKFHLEKIKAQYKKSGAIGFARMYLLDLEAAKGTILKAEWISTYPFEKIKHDWPMFAGVDYASTHDQLRRGQERDDCSICWGVLTPNRTLIVVDGIAEQLTQSEAYMELIRLVQTFPYIRGIGSESIGKGEEFTTLLQMAPIFMPIMPIPSHKGDARTKGGRFEKVLAEMFRFARIMVSDRETPFLKKTKDQWISWKDKTSRDDTLDSIYMMIMAAAGYIAVPQMQQVEGIMSPVFQERIRKPSPWRAFKNV